MSIDKTEYEYSEDRNKDRAGFIPTRVKILSEQDEIYADVSTLSPSMLPSTLGSAVIVPGSLFRADFTPIKVNDRTEIRHLALGYLKEEYSTYKTSDIWDATVSIKSEDMKVWKLGSAVLNTVVKEPEIDVVEVENSVNQHPLEILQETYKVNVPEIELIQDYFSDHPDIEEVVTIAAINTRKYFNQATEVSLEMYYDLDSEEQYLILYVRQESYSEDIIERIDKVCESYESGLANLSAWFVVSTDFQPPKYR